MRIATLSTTTAIAFQLAPSAFPITSAPPEVQARLQEGKLWHLVGWTDEENRRAGVCHKGRCVEVAWPVLHLVVGFMRPARGPGFVVLEAHHVDGSTATLIHSTTHNKPLLEWLVTRQVELSSVFGDPVTVEDWGSDY